MKKKIAVLATTLVVILIAASAVPAFAQEAAPVDRTAMPFIGSKVCEGSYLWVQIAHKDGISAGYAYVVGEKITGGQVLSHTADNHVLYQERDWFVSFLPENPDSFTYLLRVTAKTGEKVTISGIYRDMNEMNGRWDLPTAPTAVPVESC